MFQNSCRFRSRSDLVNPSDLPLIEKNPTPPHSFYARLISRVSFSWCTIFCFDGIASSHPFADISLPFTSQSPFLFACQAINSVNASQARVQASFLLYSRCCLGALGLFYGWAWGVVPASLLFVRNLPAQSQLQACSRNLLRDLKLNSHINLHWVID